jgi:ribosomal protein S18 acetylase RimI-like enzyme
MAVNELTEPVVRACREQLSTFLLFERAAGAQRLANPGIVGIETGVDFPLLNGVLESDLDDADLGPTVAAVTEHFRDQQLPMLWWHRPTARPADLGDRLLGAGFQAVGSQPVMVCDTGAVPDVPVPAGLTTRRVSDRDDLDVYASVLGRGFGLPPNVVAFFSDLLVTIGLGPDAEVRSFLGLLEGEVVATASVFLHDGVAGIYNISALEHVRGRGIGAHVTAVAMREATKEGIGFLSLQSSEAGYRIYQTLGFREVCRFHMYLAPTALGADAATPQ